MAEKQLTLMAVHAHPDDEATGTGGVLARYAAEGVRTVLVTCTDGRCGDGPGGVKPGEEGHHPDEVVAMRRKELDASCAVLGIGHLELLGYQDSGMEGWAQNEAPGAFWGTPVDEAAARLAELFETYRPDVVVTYDPNGFYFHPDHVQTHRVTMAALERTGLPAKVYWTTVPHSGMRQLGEIVRQMGEDFPEEEEPAADGRPPMGLPDHEISTWVDVRDHAKQKYDSLAAHASQEDSIFFLRLGLERFTTFMGVEHFTRVENGVPAPATPRETDLFEGLR